MAQPARPESHLHRPTYRPLRQVEAYDWAYFDTIDEMAAASSLIIVGTVTEVDTAHVECEEDLPPAAGPPCVETLVLLVSPERVVRGSAAASVGVIWGGHDVDAQGNRVAELVVNGIRIPKTGERYLLFLTRLSDRQLVL